MTDKKSDLERLGIFREEGYHTIGDPYPRPAKFTFNTKAGVGKQMNIEPSKSTSALVDGYFSQFQRCFTGEAYADQLTIRRQINKANKDKLKGKVFHLPSIPKKPEGSGSYYGTLGGPITSMSADFTKTIKKDGPSKRNFYTNPAKKGTGYGYIDVFFHKFPQYKSEPYNSGINKENVDKTKSVFKTGAAASEFFQANPYSGKFDTGYTTKSHDASIVAPKPFIFKAGRYISDPLNPWPQHQTEPYTTQRLPPLLKKVVNNTGQLYAAVPTAPKPYPQPSILDTNVNRAINNTNFGTVTSVFSL